MTNSVRFSSAVLICWAGFAASVHAQEGVKIVSTWGTNWDTGSSVTYVDGDFERDEGYWGYRSLTTESRMSSMSLRKCGEWSASYLVHGTTLYQEENSPAAGNAQEPGKGLVTVQVEFVDTGERVPKFGSTARHIITTVRYDYSQSTCSPGELSHKYDAWYIDWPYSNKCSEAHRFDFSPLGCNDRVTVKQKGSEPSGLSISMQQETEEKDRGTLFTSDVVKSLTREKLDPNLFVRPSNVLPMSEFRKPRTKEPSQPAHKDQHSED